MKFFLQGEKKKTLEAIFQFLKIILEILLKFDKMYSPGEGNGNPLQDSCLENPLDRGVWWATAHRAAKSQTRLSTTALLRLGFELRLGHPRIGSFEVNFTFY